MASLLDKWDPSWFEATPNGMRRFFRMVATDLCIASIIITAMEATLRAVGYERYFLPRVGSNEFGYREKDFSPQKPAGQCRILTLGDSTTFGTGLPWYETYPKQLEGLLEATYPGRDYLVVNAGGEAGCLQDAAEGLPENCELVDPDLVVVLLAPPTIAMQNIRNAKGQHSASNYADRVQSWFLRAKVLSVQIHSLLYCRLKVYQFIQHEIRFAFYRLGLMRENLGKHSGAVYAYDFELALPSRARSDQIAESYERTEQFLVEVRDYLEEQDIPLYVAAIPSRFMLSDLFADNFRRIDKKKARIDPYARFQRMCDDNNIPFVDVQPRLVALREDMMRGDTPWDDLFIPDDHAHLNRVGNRIVAQTILERLQEDNAVPACQPRSENDGP